MSAYIVDTETTGYKDPLLNEPIELAYARVTPRLDYEPAFYRRFQPQNRILFSAIAVHHILPIELAGEEPSAMAKAYLPTDMEYMIGHNVDYDWEVLGRPSCKRICTLAMSRKLWPGNDGHSLAALSYHLCKPEAYTELRETLKNAHGAGFDCELTHGVLQAMIEFLPTAGYNVLASEVGGIDFEKLWHFSEEARIPEFWTFGKHEGKRIEEADNGYLFWCIRQPDMDQYVKLACERALKQKGAR